MGQKEGGLKRQVYSSKRLHQKSYISNLRMYLKTREKKEEITPKESRRQETTKQGCNQWNSNKSRIMKRINKMKMILWVNTKTIKSTDKLTKRQREKIHINETGTKRRLSQQPLRNSENLKDMLSKICAPHKKT